MREKKWRRGGREGRSMSESASANNKCAYMKKINEK
jgi:hypothetical protein